MISTLDLGVMSLVTLRAQGGASQWEALTMSVGIFGQWLPVSKLGKAEKNYMKLAVQQAVRRTGVVRGCSGSRGGVTASGEVAPARACHGE